MITRYICKKPYKDPIGNKIIKTGDVIGVSFHINPYISMIYSERSQEETKIYMTKSQLKESFVLYDEIKDMDVKHAIMHFRLMFDKLNGNEMAMLKTLQKYINERISRLDEKKNNDKNSILEQKQIDLSAQEA